ncbi:MAG: glycosyltransferase family 39 protein [Chloroflexi bacterium]|nr:glycosyltransferase family 39 protein [Chloroflexota bacterium]
MTAHKWCIVVASAIAAIVRVATHSVTPLLLTPDSIAYYQMALDWRDHASWGLLLPFRTPLYPMLLGEAMRISSSPWMATLFHAVSGVITVALVADLGCRLYSTRIGLMLGAIVALYPPLIFFENYLMTETLVTTLVIVWAWGLWLYSSKPKLIAWLWLALFGGAITLTRPSLAGFLVAPMIMLVLKIKQETLQNLLTRALTYFALVLIILSPWLLYVYRATGRVTVSPVTGTQLWIYQHIDGVFNPNFVVFDPYRERYLQYKADDASQMSGWRIRADILSDRTYSIAEADQIFMNYALQSIRANPFNYGVAVIRGVGYFFGIGDHRHDEAANFLSQSLSSRDGRAAINQWAVESVGDTPPSDSRWNQNWSPFNNAIVFLSQMSHNRGIILTPLFFLGVWFLHSDSQKRDWTCTILAAILFTAISHAIFLANLDRYHWVVEPLMWLGIGAVLARLRRGAS